MNTTENTASQGTEVQPRNPVVRRTRTTVFPRWTIREYADGMFDAEHTDGALSPGFTSYRDAFEWVYDFEASRKVQA